MELLKQYLNKIYKLDPEVLKNFLSHWKPIEFNKGEIVTRAGEIEKYLYFMIDGIQKAYYLKDGKEHIIAFTTPPAFTCIPESFLTQKQSYYYLECITKSSMLQISHLKVEELAENSIQIEKLLRKSYENILAGLVVGYHQMMAYTIEERYREFVKRSPQLLNIIPHKDIASYLGMNPTNFSKLHNSIKI